MMIAHQYPPYPLGLLALQPCLLRQLRPLAHLRQRYLLALLNQLLLLALPRPVRLVNQ